MAVVWLLIEPLARGSCKVAFGPPFGFCIGVGSERGRSFRHRQNPPSGVGDQDQMLIGDGDTWTTSTSTLLMTTATGSSSGTNGSRSASSPPKKPSPPQNAHPRQRSGEWPADGGECLRLLLAFDVLRQAKQQSGFEDANHAHRPAPRKRSGRTQVRGFRREFGIPAYHVSWNSHHRRFTGVEFAVTHSEPPTFFVIQKRERLSPDEG